MNICANNGYENRHLGPDLLGAVICSDVERVSFLLLHGANVNYSDSDGNTTLHHAVVINSEQIIRLLLNTHRCNVSIVQSQVPHLCFGGEHCRFEFILSSFAF